MKRLKKNNQISINSFKDLINTCIFNKEIKLKYELEKNINLVKFEKGRIEISFNDNLDKNFVKDLSVKLFEWTGHRWIISFVKDKGDITINEKEKIRQIELLEKIQGSTSFKKISNLFPDAELVKVNFLNDYMKKKDD